MSHSIHGSTGIEIRLTPEPKEMKALNSEGIVDSESEDH
jgi:hypothetical protein